MSIDLTKTYLYKGKEIKLTGRIASKTSGRGKTIELYEIKPNDLDDDNNQHNTWVKMVELMVIERKDIK